MIANRLQKGSKIGIIAPSDLMNDIGTKELENFEKYMGGQGFEVIRSSNLFAVDKFDSSAGTPKQRADDINSMFNDNNIDAIWCAQGGNTANQTLDLIDFENIKKNPKLFLGKSDIDILLLAINKLTGLITIHCCDPKIGRNREMDLDYTKKWFEKRLVDGEKTIEPSCDWECVRKGKAEGNILGCNILSILRLAGTKYFPDFSGAVLLLEAYKSNPNTLICEMTQLKLLGVFDKISGIVIGNNFEFDGGDKKITVQEIVKELTRDIPILKINEFGHYQPHAFIPIGAKAKMDATNKTFEIIDDFVK